MIDRSIMAKDEISFEDPAILDELWKAAAAHPEDINGWLDFAKEYQEQFNAASIFLGWESDPVTIDPRAEQAWLHAIGLDPENEGYAISLLQLYTALMERFEKVEAWHLARLKEDPGDRGAWNELFAAIHDRGVTGLKRARLEEARKQTDFDEVEVEDDLRRSELDHDHSQTIQRANDVMGLFPRSVEGWCALGEMLAEDAPGEAKGCYEKALVLNPGNEEAKYFLGGEHPDPAAVYQYKALDYSAIHPSDVAALREIERDLGTLDSRNVGIDDLQHVRELSLIDRGLTSIPKSVGKLTALRTLILRDNQLDDIPSWLADLPLEELDYSNTFHLLERPQDYDPEQCNRLPTFPGWLLAKEGIWVRLQGVNITSVPASVTQAAYPGIKLPFQMRIDTNRYREPFTTDLRKPCNEIVDDMLAWFKRLGIAEATRADTEAAWETMFKAHRLAMHKFDMLFTLISHDAYDKAKKVPIAPAASFGCKYCPASFKSKGGLTNHVQSKHVEEAIAEAEVQIARSFTEEWRYDAVSLRHHIASAVAGVRMRLYISHGRYAETLDCLKTEITSYIATMTHEFELRSQRANPKDRDAMHREHKRDVRDFIKGSFQGYEALLDQRLNGQPVPSEIARGLKALRDALEGEE